MSGLEVIVGLVALGIAVPTVVETFVHVAQYLTSKIKAGNVETERIREFAGSLERGTMRTSLELAEDLYCDTSDNDLRNSIANHIELLRRKLLSLDGSLKLATGNDSNDKTKKKASKEVIGLIEEMERLENSFRSLLDVNVAAKFLPSKLELRSNLFQIIGPTNSQFVKLPHSQVKTINVDFSGVNNRWGTTQKCVLEEMTYPGETLERAYERARELGRLLEFTKASEGLLEFAGFHVVSTSPFADSRFQLIFPFPDRTSHPRSLRNILLDPINSPRPPIPRNFRFFLPRKLAEAVYHVHRHNLVHKRIRPETILIFESEAANGTRGPSYPTTIGTPYLTDWQLSRKTVESSNREPEPGAWATALYQHPSRSIGPGLVAGWKYNIGHDIYSLGVCLLEIGLWTSFLTYDKEIPSMSPLLQRRKDDWVSQNGTTAASMTPSQIEQKTFQMLAGDGLEFEMGEAYSQMVLKCLSCLEKGFGNVTKFVDSESKDWEDEGVAFINEIKKELAAASTMGSGIYNRI